MHPTSSNSQYPNPNSSLVSCLRTQQSDSGHYSNLTARLIWSSVHTNYEAIPSRSAVHRCIRQILNAVRALKCQIVQYINISLILAKKTGDGEQKNIGDKGHFLDIHAWTTNLLISLVTETAARDLCVASHTKRIKFCWCKCKGQ